MTATTPTPETKRPWRIRRWPGRHGVAIVLVTGLAAGATAWGLLRPASPKPSAIVDRAASLEPITERTITSQQLVNGTLGFAGASSVLQPVGTFPDAVTKADEQTSTANHTLEQARADLAAAEATLADDSRILASDQARLSAGRQKEVSDCQVSGAAAGSTPCEADRDAVAADQKQVDADSQKVSADQKAVARAAAAVTGAEQSLSFARSAAADAHGSALSFGQASRYTALPAIGQVVERGEPLFSVSARPVPLLFGTVIPWRPFRAGMSGGADVAALNQNLADLGYGPGLAGSEKFSSSTAAGIRKLQDALGLPRTGELLLGSVVFQPGPARITSVTPKLGAAVQPGTPVIDVTSTARQVTVKLDAAQQSQVEVGDPVVITLPNKKTTPATVSAVGTVATEPPSSAADIGSSSQPTVDVVITPSDSAATGDLDAAPVQVSITTASIDHALVVPVTALLALSGGGYGVDVVSATGVHHLEAVTIGLFDDAHGLVQITGANIHASDQVAVASS